MAVFIRTASDSSAGADVGNTASGLRVFSAPASPAVDPGRTRALMRASSQMAGLGPTMVGHRLVHFETASWNICDQNLGPRKTRSLTNHAAILGSFAIWDSA